MPLYIVLKGVRPQTRRICTAPGLRSGVLVDGEPVTVFANRRQARRAITRSEETRRKLSDPVCGIDFRDSPTFASLLSPEPWTVVPVELLNANGDALPEVSGEVVNTARLSSPVKAQPAEEFPLFAIFGD